MYVADSRAATEARGALRPGPRAAATAAAIATATVGTTWLRPTEPTPRTA